MLRLFGFASSYSDMYRISGYDLGHPAITLRHSEATGAYSDMIFNLLKEAYGYESRYLDLNLTYPDRRKRHLDMSLTYPDV